MANRYRGELEVDLGGRRLTFHYDYDALARLEAALGADYLGAVNRAVLSLNPRRLAEIAATGLARHHEDLQDPLDVMAFSPPLMPLGQAIQAALRLAVMGPDPQPQPDAGKRRAQPGAPVKAPAIGWRLPWRRRKPAASGPGISGA